MVSDGHKSNTFSLGWSTTFHRQQFLFFFVYILRSMKREAFSKTKNNKPIQNIPLMDSNDDSNTQFSKSKKNNRKFLPAPKIT